MFKRYLSDDWVSCIYCEFKRNHLEPIERSNTSIPLVPNGEYAVTTMSRDLQYSTRSLCWRNKCISICRTLGLMVLLAHTLSTCSLLKFDNPIALNFPLLTCRSNAWNKQDSTAGMEETWNFYCLSSRVPMDDVINKQFICENRGLKWTDHSHSICSDDWCPFSTWRCHRCQKDAVRHLLWNQMGRGWGTSQYNPISV